jgi:hypothetical protein
MPSTHTESTTRERQGSCTTDCTPQGPPLSIRGPGASLLIDAHALRVDPGRYLLLDENNVFTVVPLTRAGTRIGSSFTADIRLEDPTVSRRHALVLRSANGHRILADSGAGLYVNGERVETSPLNHGDEIRVGRHRLYYLTSGGPPNAGTPMVGYDAATLPTQLFWRVAAP